MDKLILNPNLSANEQYAILQVVANLELSGMHPSVECIRNLEDIALGKKTADQVIEEIKRKYQK